MIPEQKDLIQWAVVQTATKKCRQFRRLNTLILVSLAVAVLVVVLYREMSGAIPSWLVLLLTATLVVYALGFAAINQAFKEVERRAWADLLALLPPSSVGVKGSEGAASRPVAHTVRPRLRVFKPDQPS